MDFFKFIKSNSRWLCGGLLLTTFSSFGQTFFISLFSDNLREKFSLSDGQFGTIYMVATLVSAFVLVQLGRIVDKFSIANVSVFVIVMLALSCVSMAVVNSVAALFVTIFAMRLLGQGMMTHVSQTAMGRWYDSGRGTAISITSLGHNIGEAILPKLVLVISVALGWQASWWAAAGVLLVVVLPATYMLMKEPRTTASKLDGTIATAQRQWSRSDVLRDWNFYWIAAGVLAPAFVATAFYFHHKHLLNVKRWADSSYATAFLFLAMSSIAAKLLAGKLIDQFGAIKILPLFLIPMTASCFMISLGQSNPTLYLIAICFGVSMGFVNSTLGAIWPEVYGVTHLGAIRSLAFAGVVFASAFGSGLTGWLIDFGIGIETQFLTMGIYCLIATGLMLAVSRRLERASLPSFRDR